MMYERHDCRLCGQLVKTVLELVPTPLANLFPSEPMTGEFYPLELRQCVSCAHVQIGHVVADSVLYPRNQRQSKSDEPVTGYKYSTPQALKPALAKRAKDLRRLYPKARNVVEIGSNNGLFLDALAESFPSVIGVDPCSTAPLAWKMPFDKDAAKLIRARIGEIDLIVANNVFAHIDNLRHVFDAIDNVLSPRGAVVFEVQYLIPMLERGEFDMIYHEHRDYHALGPLARFLRSCGLVMTDWKLLENHGGSIRVTAKRSGKQAPIPNEPTDWRAFMSNIAQRRAEVSLQIGVKIPAFGAPAKAVTLIHQFGLQDRIAYCVDDTPEKQGRYIAGTKIPVVSRGILDLHKPVCMLLFSWNYEAIIRQSLPGIDFITPFQTAYA